MNEKQVKDTNISDKNMNISNSVSEILIWIYFLMNENKARLEYKWKEEVGSEEGVGEVKRDKEAGAKEANRKVKCV